MSLLRRERDVVGRKLKDLLPRLWRFALSLTGDPSLADDLVQATCVRALERADQFDPNSRIHSWAFAILASQWKNHLRAERIRRPAADLDEAALSVADSRPHAEKLVLAKQVLSELGKLPDIIRVTVSLVYIEGLTYREAASALDIPVGTVMSRLASARKTLGRLNSEASTPDGGHRS